MLNLVNCSLKQRNLKASSRHGSRSVYRDPSGVSLLIVTIRENIVGWFYCSGSICLSLDGFTLGRRRVTEMFWFASTCLGCSVYYLARQELGIENSPLKSSTAGVALLLSGWTKIDANGDKKCMDGSPRT
ncbi:hypothetical protein KI387_000996, partial [Taxus chinensis]